MKKQYALALALALTVSLSAGQTVMASEHGHDGEGSVTGSVTVGASFNDDDDNTTIASEYSSMSDRDVREVVGGSLHIHSGKTVLGVEGMYMGPDEQEYKGHLDLGRILQIHGGYQEFWHRLGQDELLNMNAQSAGAAQGATLWHTYDYAPGYGINSTLDGNGLYSTNQLVPEHEFGISRSEFEATGKIKFPTIPGLTIGLHQRSERREGTQQVMAMSKCASCHIVAHEKDIDESTTDVKPFIQYNMGKLSLEYSYLNRKFDSSGNSVIQHYDEVHNPLSGAVGDLPDRVNYTGDLEISRTPDTRKQVHSVKAKYDVSADQNFYAGYVYANMENNDVAEASASNDSVTFGESSLETDYNAGMLTWHNRFSKDLMMNATVRYQTIDADDVFVNLDDTDTGTIDLTSEYVPPYDYTRESDEDRDILTLKADLRYRLTKDITLRGGLEFEDVDRDNCEFLVDSDTTTYKAKVGTSWRLAKGLRLKADYKFTYVDEPYTFENSVFPDNNSCATGDGVCSVPRTSNTAGGIYSQYVYGMRAQNTSDTPEYEHDIKLKANWNIAANMDLAAYLRYTYGENDEDVNYDYEDEVVDTGLDFTFSPADNLTASFGYNYYLHETDSAFYIPFYHG